jgi:hypothetical protein
LGGNQCTGIYFKVEPAKPGPILYNSVIGDQSNPFRGVLDGNNEVVQFVVDLTGRTGNSYVGLFAYLGDGAVIHDLTVQADIKGANDYVGGIAGYANGGVTITTCIVKGKIQGRDHTGGIVGYANIYGSGSQEYDDKIMFCRNYAIVDGRNNVGGIVGNSLLCRTSVCSNVGNITGEGTIDGTGMNVGGIVGAINGGIGNSIFDYSTNAGMITGRTNVGGIAGYCNGHLRGDINAGVVKASFDYIGGVCGYFNGDNFYTSINVAPVVYTGSGSANNIGGIAGYLSNNLHGDTVFNCVYDNQMCPLQNTYANKKVLDMPTASMLGTMLGQYLASGIFLFSDNLYPRRGNTDIDYVAAAPIVLNGDTYDNVKNAFDVYGNNIVQWEGEFDWNPPMPNGRHAQHPNRTGEIELMASYGDATKRIPINVTAMWKISVTNQTTAFTIGAVTPMPVRDNANLTITAHQDGKLNAKLYNLSGIEVANLMDTDAQVNSNYNLNLNAGNLASGTYMLIVSLGDEIASRQIVVNE